MCRYPFLWACVNSKTLTEIHGVRGHCGQPRWLLAATSHAEPTPTASWCHGTFISNPTIAVYTSRGKFLYSRFPERAQVSRARLTADLPSSMRTRQALVVTKTENCITAWNSCSGEPAVSAFDAVCRRVARVGGMISLVQARGWFVGPLVPVRFPHDLFNCNGRGRYSTQQWDHACLFSAHISKAAPSVLDYRSSHGPSVSSWVRTPEELGRAELTRTHSLC